MSARRSRSLSATIPLYGLLPYFTTWTFVPAYLYLQPVILHHHLIPFVFYIGLINAYSVGQIIIGHLTKSEFPYQNVLTIPIGLAVLDSLGPKTGLWPSALGDGTYQIGFMFACLGLGIGVYGSFVVSFFVYFMGASINQYSTTSSRQFVTTWISGAYQSSTLTMSRTSLRSRNDLYLVHLKKSYLYSYEV